MKYYKAIKEGWDGSQIRKPGEVFPFEGKKGSWMAECDAAGNLKEGEKAPVPPRDVRHGASASKTLSREELRAQCTAKGIKFKATLGAADLAKLLKDHDEQEAFKKQSEGKSSENPDGGAPGVNTQSVTNGTGDQDVL